jgi:RNA polymerase sigma-70 factor (ECF subfamily)
MPTETQVPDDRNDASCRIGAQDTGTACSAESDEEREIIELCQAGNREGQRRLYERFHVMVFRLMVRIHGEQDAADLTQQVFLRTFRKIHQFRDGSQLQTWLYRLAINEALQFRRRHVRWRFMPLPPHLIDGQGSHIQRTENRELLDVAIHRIDPNLWAIFTLREMEGLSYREIATILDIPEGTVASRLNRARKELQSRLIQLGWQP